MPAGSLDSARRRQERQRRLPEEQARQRKRQNDLKKVEDEIHKLETRDGEIDGLLCDESVFSDVAKLMELNKEKEEIAGKLEVLYEKWEELAE